MAQQRPAYGHLHSHAQSQFFSSMVKSTAGTIEITAGLQHYTGMDFFVVLNVVILGQQESIHLIKNLPAETGSLHIQSV